MKLDTPVQDEASQLFNECEHAFQQSDHKTCLKHLRHLNQIVRNEEHPLFQDTLALSIAVALDAAQTMGHIEKEEIMNFLLFDEPEEATGF